MQISWVKQLCHVVSDFVSSVKPSVFSGGFAKVKLGRHIQTGEKVAIKIMNKKDLGVRGKIPCQRRLRR